MNEHPLLKALAEHEAYQRAWSKDKRLQAKRSRKALTNFIQADQELARYRQETCR